MPLLHLHLEEHKDLNFLVHSTTGEELALGRLSVLWAGSSQVGGDTEQTGLVESAPASGLGTRLRYLPTQVIYHSMTSFHHLLPTTKHYSEGQHRRVNRKN